MIETPGGHRLLLAPTPAVAGYVAATYRFDEVHVTPVDVVVDGPLWRVDAGPLALRFGAGDRPALGVALRAVPRSLATRVGWIRAADVAARRLLPGVRTHGTAHGGRHEFYAALDLHRIVAAAVTWDGADQGPLARLDPPVRFGFGSVPPDPALVRMVTLVRHPPPAG